MTTNLQIHRGNGSLRLEIDIRTSRPDVFVSRENFTAVMSSLRRFLLAPFHRVRHYVHGNTRDREATTASPPPIESTSNEESL